MEDKAVFNLREFSVKSVKKEISVRSKERDAIGARSGWTIFGVVAALILVAATQPAKNLVVNGDFEKGNTGFTTAYSFSTTDISSAGYYTIGTNPSKAPGAYGDWGNFGDHTTGTGNMMIVNGSNPNSLLVWQEVVSVKPSTNYIFAYWGADVDQNSSSLPSLVLNINDKRVGSPAVFPKNSPDAGGKWQLYTFKWSSGSSTHARLAIFDLNTSGPANDFALDDISFTEVQNQ
jgi:hypothetical protein